ncbi:MAG: CocE/NonD family hydrolase, partial [Phyllobacteriaceae bacterium]|nr:CocE/NonD family hydrolase [Phyllobacteriaceae bacterium]
MKVIKSFPRKVKEIENFFIPLSDGTKLAARMWLPRDAEKSPVPALLEFLPYRKRDGPIARDALTHPYFAGHGYGAVRVDMRGNGDSDGLMDDEYTKRELEDGLEVIAWLARQTWCSGKVGMFGISWGGFNALQVAALRPPALKAIVSLCSTDDRYEDDVHYKGGTVLNEMHGWAATMLAYSARPPDPDIVGKG